MTFNELAVATGLEIHTNYENTREKHTAIRFITENGLTVFEHYHKVGITCQPSVDSDTKSMIVALTPELFDMIVKSYKDTRAEIKSLEEKERLEHLKEVFKNTENNA